MAAKNAQFAGSKRERETRKVFELRFKWRQPWEAISRLMGNYILATWPRTLPQRLAMMLLNGPWDEQRKYPWKQCYRRRHNKATYMSKVIFIAWSCRLSPLSLHSTWANTESPWRRLSPRFAKAWTSQCLKQTKGKWIFLFRLVVG